MTATYLNPVFNHPAPDPFVFKHRGEYWCISSHCEPGQRKFEMLRSPDLVHWEIVGGALDPLAEEHPYYWAPEVMYDNGVFYLYYSVGNEILMQLRVATSRKPQGPYIDQGIRLTPQDFAIDAHIFVDDDGQRWIFYATDFLEHTRIGTGTVVDRMLDPLTLEGNPRPVARAQYDWQVYDPARESKGGVKWHTVEGSFALKRKGRYYHMFSGGNWTNQTYGVAYAVSDRIDRADEWDQPCDGQQRGLVLRTIPDVVVGPGHNSVVRAPDNRQLVVVYHRWVEGARVLSMDPLDWAGDRLIALGPSHTPQPVPPAPTIRGFDAARFDGGQWTTAPATEDTETTEQPLSPRRPLRQNNSSPADSLVARQTDTRRRAGARWDLPAPQFIFEATGRVLDGRGAWGIDLFGEGGRTASVAIRPAEATLTVTTRGAQRAFPLRRDFDGSVDHLLRIEADGARLTALVDTAATRFRFKLPFEPYGVALFTDGVAAEFAAPEITLGWEELFDGPEKSPQDLDFDADRGWSIAGGELRSPRRTPAIVAKATPSETCEVVINARVLDAEEGGGYALFPAGAAVAPSAPGNGPNVWVRAAGSGWRLEAMSGAGEVTTWPLPANFNAREWRQWRFRVGETTVTVALEDQPLGELALAHPATHIALAAVNATIACDMIRVTALHP